MPNLKPAGVDMSVLRTLNRQVLHHGSFLGGRLQFDIEC